jgi:hypothetical protein
LNFSSELMSPESATTLVYPRSCSSNVAIIVLLGCYIDFIKL